MVEFVKRMIDEHAELVVRIQKLHNYIYSEASDKDISLSLLISVFSLLL